MSRAGSILELTQRLRGECFVIPDLIQLPEVAIARGAAVAALKGHFHSPLLLDMNRTVVAIASHSYAFLQMPQRELSRVVTKDGFGMVGRMPPLVLVSPPYAMVALEDDSPDTLADEFSSLVDKWERETEFHSSLAAKFTHAAYQRIMAMGKPALSLILSELQRKPGHWFYALSNIVGKDVAAEAGAKTFAEARNAWLGWGRKNDYIK